jgi:hypothetical protein
MRFLVLILILIQTPLWAQSPEVALSELSEKNRAWVNQSCPKSLGPSLWTDCVLREANAAKIGKPDLSGLKGEIQEWLNKSCPDSLGPSLTIRCLNRELAALGQNIPDLSALTDEQKDWLLNTCPISLGPSLWISCVKREFAALSGTKSVPQNSPGPLSKSQRSYRSAPNSYVIEVAHNDEIFIINGEKYEAKTYCIGWEKSDRVIFLEGSAFGACASAELYNLRTEEKCSCWCE